MVPREERRNALRVSRVEHVQDEVGVVDVLHSLEVVALELRADRVDPFLVSGEVGVPQIAYRRTGRV